MTDAVKPMGSQAAARFSYAEPLKKLDADPIQAASARSLTTLASAPNKPKPTYISKNPMLRNLERQLSEDGSLSDLIPQLIQDVESKKPVAPLYLSYDAVEAQGGYRPSMEDAHCILKTDKGLILCICDGHGEEGKIANLFAKVTKKFEERLKAIGDIAITMQSLIDEVHQEVLKKNIKGGSTVLLAFIDQKNIVTVATLGDSEARVARGKRLIPVSRVLDWKHPKEALRAALALRVYSLATLWPLVPKDKAKLLRAPSFGPNLSRALGDQIYQKYLPDPSQPLIIQKAKITQFRLKADSENEDILILACDGLWDVVNKNELIEKVIHPNRLQPASVIAAKIRDYALYTKNSTDNVSVIVVKVHQKPQLDAISEAN